MRLRHAIALAAALAAGAEAQVTLPPSAGISPAARAALAADAARPPAGPAMADRRARAEAIQREIGGRMLARYKVEIAEQTMAGVPVRIFTPRGWRPGDPVLLNLHGGGFVVDSGSWTENVPVAALTGYRVVAVLYRLAPEHVFPAARDDAEAVYRALLSERPARRIGLYGTSAGAILSTQLVARLRALGLPLPAALGFFSGSADLSVTDDAMQLYGGPGIAQVARMYAGARALDDPALSPLRGALRGWPPTMCLTSGRDFLQGTTSSLCRALDEQGVQANLQSFDGLPHAFWSYVEAPESDLAFAAMARFLRGNLKERP